MILFEWGALEVAVLYSGVLPDSASGVPTAVSAMIMGAITCCYAWSLALSQVASSRVGEFLFIYFYFHVSMWAIRMTPLFNSYYR